MGTARLSHRHAFDDYELVATATATATARLLGLDSMTPNSEAEGGNSETIEAETPPFSRKDVWV